jgi:ParB family chromosome partitioning protein
MARLRGQRAVCTTQGDIIMTATIQTVHLSQLKPNAANPRTSFDPQRIEELAATILQQGVLQNLVVKRAKGRKVTYTVVAGGRRLRALQLLHERGELPEDYPVPVLIRSGLSDTDTLWTATIENVQREPLEPLDEAHAYATLLQSGTPLDEVNAETGVSATTIRRRLALTSLVVPAQDALRNHQITLGQAEALTLGSVDAQHELVSRLLDAQDYSAADLREILLDERIPVAASIFDRELYTGTVTTDLFANDDSTYFDDIGQFWELQRQAVTALAEQYRESAAWVELTESYTLSAWQYRKARDGEAAGVLINLSPTGRVEMRDGLVKHDMSTPTADLTADSPLAPRPKPAYSAVLCEIIAHEKSLAVQAALLADPRKAKEVAVVLMLAVNDCYDRPLDLTPHRCLYTGADAPEPSNGYAALEQHAHPLATQVLPEAAGEDKPVWKRLLKERRDAASLYGAIKVLSDADLDTLHLLLPILCFGQGHCDRLDTKSSFFNQVACDLGVDMRQWWRPDAAYLKRRTKAQLIEIAQDSGAMDTLESTPHTKAELVTALSAYFAEGTDAARNWLPGAMHFPAVEPEGAAEPIETDTGTDAAAA